MGTKNIIQLNIDCKTKNRELTMTFYHTVLTLYKAESVLLIAQYEYIEYYELFKCFSNIRLLKEGTDSELIERSLFDDDENLINRLDIINSCNLYSQKDFLFQQSFDTVIVERSNYNLGHKESGRGMVVRKMIENAKTIILFNNIIPGKIF